MYFETRTVGRLICNFAGYVLALMLIIALPLPAWPCSTANEFAKMATGFVHLGISVFLISIATYLRSNRNTYHWAENKPGGTRWDKISPVEQKMFQFSLIFFIAAIGTFACFMLSKFL